MHDISMMGHMLYDIRCYTDDFPMPDKMSLTKGRIKYSAGGSACNSAVCASNLGKNVTICGKIGFDDYGIFLIQNFISKRVDTSNVIIDYHEPSGVSVVIINREGEPEIVEMLGANEPISVKDIKSDFFDTKIVHMTGTNLSALMYVSTSAKERGIKVMFDPGRSASHLGYTKLEPILKNCDVIISNRVEMARLMEIEDERNAAIEKIAERAERLLKDKVLIIKQGSDKTIVLCDKSFEVNTFRVNVVDTLGAGDTFAGAFATAMVEGKSFEDCTVFANGAAALKVTREGAQSSPSREELETFLEKEDAAINYLPL
ncbi:MAG: carbohydrate kinase family protein [Candidatus Thermoplasmatota archaeon]|nr:carbohydrate kinase family protein [Candidatus Thermoplasmatota archaeon]